MEDMETGVFLAIVVGTSVLLIVAAQRLGKASWLFLLLPVFCLLASLLWLAPDLEKKILLGEVPVIGREQFASSDQCRSCHIEQYESWHHSYHRTMTQLASEQSILAPFDGRTLEAHGVTCRVERRGDWFMVEMPDPDWESSEFPEGIDASQEGYAPRVELPVVMTTGSHHLQAYWVPSFHGNKLRIFPWVFHIDEQRWIPNKDSFLSPPDAKRYPQVWNNSCVRCHSVAGDPGYAPLDWQSQVAELGIACEACHGPGEKHVLHHQNPLNRYAQHFSSDPDPSIVNPAKLPTKQVSEACGQCHSPFDDDAGGMPFNSFRPGDDFSKSFRMADPHNPDDVRFWSDGTLRVGGREYAGMLESPCYRNGEMTCLSCHSMHSSSPDLQLDPRKQNDAACTQCHQETASNLEAHTHHSPQSEGSRCMNCHMPHTSYALLRGVRSHRIDSPDVSTSVETGKPNACNQCHVDQSLEWTSFYLNQWYGIDPPTLSDEQKTVAASLLWLLKGDAVQRALAAWTLGWAPARTASGEHWQSVFLAQLLDDPYSVVRSISANSLRSLDADLGDYDFLTARSEPTETRPRLENAAVDTSNLPESVRMFFDEQQRLRSEVLRRLVEQRDERPITLVE